MMASMLFQVGSSPGTADDERSSLVRCFPHLVERDGAGRAPEFACLLLPAALAEDIDLLAAVGQTNPLMFSTIEHRKFEFLHKLDRLARVEDCHILRW